MASTGLARCKVPETECEDVSLGKGNACMRIEDREETEWSNTWIDDAHDLTRHRILLIGDSVARQYRGRLRKRLIDTSVDFIGTSFSLDDPMLYRLLDCFLASTEYQYDLLLFNLGGKHGYYLRTADEEDDARKYTAAFEAVLDTLLGRFPKAALLLTTPNVRKKRHGQWDEAVNREIEKRNALASASGGRRGLAVIDLYGFCKERSLRYGDRQHLLDEEEYFKLTDFLCGELVRNGLLESSWVRPWKPRNAIGTFVRRLLGIRGRKGE